MTLYRRWIGRSHPLEDVEIQFHSVLLLTRRGSDVRQRSERLPIFGLVGIKRLSRLSRSHPRVLFFSALVRPEPVVVGAVGARRIGPRHDAPGRSIAPQEQVVSPVHIPIRTA